MYSDHSEEHLSPRRPRQTRPSQHYSDFRVSRFQQRECNTRPSFSHTAPFDSSSYLRPNETSHSVALDRGQSAYWPHISEKNTHNSGGDKNWPVTEHEYSTDWDGHLSVSRSCHVEQPEQPVRQLQSYHESLEKKKNWGPVFDNGVDYVHSPALSLPKRSLHQSISAQDNMYSSGDTARPLSFGTRQFKQDAIESSKGQIHLPPGEYNHYSCSPDSMRSQGRSDQRYSWHRNNPYYRPEPKSSVSNISGEFQRTGEKHQMAETRWSWPVSHVRGQRERMLSIEQCRRFGSEVFEPQGLTTQSEANLNRNRHAGRLLSFSDENHKVSERGSIWRDSQSDQQPIYYHDRYQKNHISQPQLSRQDEEREYGDFERNTKWEKRSSISRGGPEDTLGEQPGLHPQKPQLKQQQQLGPTWDFVSMELPFGHSHNPSQISSSGILAEETTSIEQSKNKWSQSSYTLPSNSHTQTRNRSASHGLHPATHVEYTGLMQHTGGPSLAELDSLQAELEAAPLQQEKKAPAQTVWTLVQFEYDKATNKLVAKNID